MQQDYIYAYEYDVTSINTVSYTEISQAMFHGGKSKLSILDSFI